MQTVPASLDTVPPACTPGHVARRVSRMAGIIRSAKSRSSASLSLLILDELGRIFPLDGQSETSNVPYRFVSDKEDGREDGMIAFIGEIVRNMRRWGGKRIDAIVLEYSGIAGSEETLLKHLHDAFLKEGAILSPDSCVGMISGKREIWIAGQYGSPGRVLHVVNGD